MHPSTSVGSFIKFGWETFKKRPWFLISAFLLVMIAQWIVNFIAGMISGAADSGGVSTLGNILSIIVLYAGQILIGMGYISFFLKARDSIETVQISDLWNPQNFWKYLGMMILFYAILMVGFILLIVPGVIAAITFSFAPYLVIDKGLGPIEALKESARTTKGNRLRLFALFGATALLMLLGVMALFFGIFVAMPVTLLASIEAYRRFSGAAANAAVPQPLTGGEKTLAIIGGGVPVVLFVVGIIASVLLASLNLAQETGDSTTTTIVQMKELQLGLEMYYDDNNATYPSNLGDTKKYLQTASQDINSILIEKFLYTPNQDRSEYKICAIDPVPAGEKSCAISANSATSTPQQ